MHDHQHEAPRADAPRDEFPTDPHATTPNDSGGGWLDAGPLRMVRRVGVAIVGFAVLAVGVVLLVTPGPAFVVIPIGLGILSLEFEWARRWLKKAKEYARNLMAKKNDPQATH